MKCFRLTTVIRVNRISHSDPFKMKMSCDYLKEGILCQVIKPHTMNRMNESIIIID